MNAIKKVTTMLENDLQTNELNVNIGGTTVEVTEEVLNTLNEFEKSGDLNNLDNSIKESEMDVNDGLAYMGVFSGAVHDFYLFIDEEEDSTDSNWCNNSGKVSDSVQLRNGSEDTLINIADELSKDIS